MSERRALEYCFKFKLDEAFAGSEYSIVESNRLEERPLPVIVIIAADARQAVDHPDAMDNFITTIDLVIISEFDEQTINGHTDTTDKCLRTILKKDNRLKSNIKYLSLYDVTYLNQNTEREARKIMTNITIEAKFHYNPYEEA